VSFDFIAPHYCWLETIAFANTLQAARVAFVDQIGVPKRALIVGEGNGRFLQALLRNHPAITVDCVDASARMLNLARKRVRNDSRVQFLQRDLRNWSPEKDAYDLIVTHFFFDCFGEVTLGAIVEKLAAASSAEAQWLIADFCLPGKNLVQWPARFCLGMMYLFFRIVARIEAQRLTAAAPFLQRQSFTLAERKLFAGEMVQSEWWQRDRGPKGS
jgi:SAM-dependent methyltransferase